MNRSSSIHHPYSLAEAIKSGSDRKRSSPYSYSDVSLNRQPIGEKNDKITTSVFHVSNKALKGTTIQQPIDVIAVVQSINWAPSTFQHHKNININNTCPPLEIHLTDPSLPIYSCIRILIYGKTLISKFMQLQMSQGSIAQFLRLSFKSSAFLLDTILNRSTTQAPITTSTRHIYTVIADFTLDTRDPEPGIPFNLLSTRSLTRNDLMFEEIVQELETWSRSTFPPCNHPCTLVPFDIVSATRTRCLSDLKPNFYYSSISTKTIDVIVYVCSFPTRSNHAIHDSSTIVILQDVSYQDILSMRTDGDGSLVYFIDDSHRFKEELRKAHEHHQRILLTHVQTVDKNDERKALAALLPSSCPCKKNVIVDFNIYLVPTKPSQIIFLDDNDESDSLPLTMTNPSSSSLASLGHIPMLPIISIIWKISWYQTGFAVEHGIHPTPFFCSTWLRTHLININNGQYRPAMITLHHPLLDQRISVHASERIMRILCGSCCATQFNLIGTAQEPSSNHDHVAIFVLQILQGLLSLNIELEWSFKADRIHNIEVETVHLISINA